MVEGKEIQSPERRVFLKKTGLVLASTLGIAWGVTSLGYALDRPSLNKLYAATQKYASNPVDVRDLEDFALSGEELVGINLCPPEEQELTFLKINPFRGKSDLFSLGKAKGAPICEEWFVVEYSRKLNYPFSKLFILTNKFGSDSDCRETEKIIRGPYDEPGQDIHTSFFSKAPYIGVFATIGETNDVHRKEYALRAGLYQKKRGLDLVIRSK